MLLINATETEFNPKFKVLELGWQKYGFRRTLLQVVKRKELLL
jgi:hypothetical protein